MEEPYFKKDEFRFFFMEVILSLVLKKKNKKNITGFILNIPRSAGVDVL